MKTLIIILFFMLFASTMVAQVSEDFLIGCYSYMKALPAYEAFHDSVITYLDDAYYNATMFETYESSISYTNTLIGKLSAKSIDSYLCDYYWDHNADTGAITSGTHAISTGNSWLFEAEYGADNQLNSDRNEFYYMFNHRDRRGSNSLDGTRNVWKCNAEGESADTPGIALHGLKYRWQNYNPGYDATSWEGEHSFGGEFKFASWGESQPETISYMQNNKLYLKYLIRVEDGTSTSPELSFACKFSTNILDDKGDPIWVRVPLKNVLTTSSPADSIVYSCADMRSDLFTTPENDHPGSLYRYLTFEVDFSDLLSTNCISCTNYWYSTLYGIDPYVRWFGGHTVYIDNVEIKDKMYDTLESQPATVSSWMSGRLFSDAARHYTLDEPSQPQFKALQHLNGGNDVAGILSTTKAISTINGHGHRMKKADNTRYSHPMLYLDTAGPSELMVDYYALLPSNNWNIVSYNGQMPDSSIKNTMQWNLDWGALQHYRKLRKETQNPRKKLYVVPPTFGRWDPTNSKWKNYQYPTPKMARCLQLLPLCYGVDGVFNYYLYNPDYRDSTPSPYTIKWPNDTYGIVDDASRYAKNQHSLLEVSGHGTPDFNIISTDQYNEVREANRKLKRYGNIINSALYDLTWRDAATIGTSGLFLYENAYEDCDVSGTLWDTYLDSLYVLASDGMYSGFVQSGFYSQGSSNLPWYMIVNRRTDFATDSSGTLESVPVGDLRSGVGYNVASLQVVRYVMNQTAHDTFGTYIGLYDPDVDHQVHTSISGVIDVEIGPGDGKLLQMCSTLPTLVTNNAELKNIAYLSGDIIIDNGAQVTIHPGTDTNIFANTSILVKGGATLTLSGQVIAGNNVSIRAELGSTISFDDAVCKWGQNSRLVIDSSTLISVKSSHMSSPDATLWSGINAMNGSLVKLENTNIAGSMENRIIDSNLIMHRCKVNVPPNGTGIAFENSSYDYYARITSPTNNYGFFGNSAGNNCGLDVTYSKGNVFLHKIKFTGLQSGIRFTSASLDTLWACVFEDNEYGIKLLASRPYIYNCTFDVCIKGISSEFDSCPIVLCNRPNGIYYSTFSNCVIGLETKNANHVLKNNTFTGNIYGVRSGFDSNLNLSYDSNNVFCNTEWNVSFFVYQDPGLYPKMQLYRGHNDFYHSYDGDQCYDFSFVGTWSGFGNQINASGNWFEGSEFTVDDPSFRSRIKVDYYDTQPNVPSIPEDPKRIDLAMTNEDQGLYDLAMTQYRAILDSMSDNEKDVWSCAADGVYRLSNLVSDQSSSYTDYFALKANQYEQDDQNTSVMLSNYQMKLHVAQSEFQEAIDIIQNRIDESSCEIDSLSAVMDLEVVLMLSDMNSQKRPVFTKFEQFKYPNLQIFHQKHEEHRVLLDELLNGTDDGLIPIPGKALISSNYPNPFNPSTTIAYSIPQDGLVWIGIYNIKGQKVKDLCNSEMLRGHHKVLWDGKDANQRNVSSGIYFVKLQSSGVSSTRKIMLMK